MPSVPSCPCRPRASRPVQCSAGTQLGHGTVARQDRIQKFSDQTAGVLSQLQLSCPKYSSFKLRIIFTQNKISPMQLHIIIEGHNLFVFYLLFRTIYF